jgi:diguanylate cyclase (GGDEF)-like protein
MTSAERGNEKSKPLQTLESQLFCRGFGYRYGGDEYVVLLPNASSGTTLDVLKGFQTRLAELRYEVGISRKPTVSIGYCVVEPECWFTEREIEGKAAAAKNFAKTKGKNRIATFEGDGFEETQLVIVHGEV